MADRLLIYPCTIRRLAVKDDTVHAVTVIDQITELVGIICPVGISHTEGADIKY